MPAPKTHRRYEPGSFIFQYIKAAPAPPASGALGGVLFQLPRNPLDSLIPVHVPQAAPSRDPLPPPRDHHERPPPPPPMAAPPPPPPPAPHGKVGKASENKPPPPPPPVAVAKAQAPMPPTTAATSVVAPRNKASTTAVAPPSKATQTVWELHSRISIALSKAESCGVPLKSLQQDIKWLELKEFTNIKTGFAGWLKDQSAYTISQGRVYLTTHVEDTVYIGSTGNAQDPPVSTQNTEKARPPASIAASDKIDTTGICSTILIPNVDHPYADWYDWCCCDCRSSLCPRSEWIALVVCALSAQGTWSLRKFRHGYGHSHRHIVTKTQGQTHTQAQAQDIEADTNISALSGSR